MMMACCCRGVCELLRVSLICEVTGLLDVLAYRLAHFIQLDGWNGGETNLMNNSYSYVHMHALTCVLLHTCPHTVLHRRDNNCTLVG